MACLSAGVILAVMISVFLFCIELLSPSSAQAPYLSPRRRRQGSFISLRLLSPSNPRRRGPHFVRLRPMAVADGLTAGLRWGPPLGLGVPGQGPGECGRRIAGRYACPTREGGPFRPNGASLRCPCPVRPTYPRVVVLALSVPASDCGEMDRFRALAEHRPHEGQHRVSRRWRCTCAIWPAG